MNITQSMTVKEIIDNDNGEITKEDIKMAEYLYQEDKLREEEPTRPEYEPKIEIAKMKESSQSCIILEAVQKPLISLASSSNCVVSFLFLIATLKMSI